jgi:hypothetical protein
MRYLNK